MDLSRPPTNNPQWALALPLLVLVTTWAQSKLTVPSTPPSDGDDGKPSQSQAMTQSMTTIMPLMFGFFSLNFSVGLSIYFVVSNLIGIVQYSMMGQSKLKLGQLFGRKPAAEGASNGKQPAKRASETPARSATNGAKVKTKIKTRNK